MTSSIEREWILSYKSQANAAAFKSTTESQAGNVLRCSRAYNCPELSMPTGTLVLPSWLPCFSMFTTISYPEITLPKTTCLPSNLHDKSSDLTGTTEDTWQNTKHYCPRTITWIPSGLHTTCRWIIIYDKSRTITWQNSPRGLRRADEELRAIGVFTGVGHRQSS